MGEGKSFKIPKKMLGHEYRTIALQMIRNFLKANNMETTLMALEMEQAEVILELEKVQLPSLSLLALIDKYYEEMAGINTSVDIHFDRPLIGYNESSIPILNESNNTCIAAFKSLELNSDMILTGGTDKLVKLARIDTGEIIVYNHHNTPVLSVSSYPKDHNYALSSSMDGYAILFNISGKVIQTFKDHQKYTHRTIFSPSGDFLVTASYDKTIRFYKKLPDAVEFKFEYIKEKKFNGVVDSLAFSNDTLILGVRGDNNLHYISLLESFKHEKFNMNPNLDSWVSFSVLDLACSPCGKYIAVYTDSKAGRVIVFNQRSSIVVMNFWDLDVDEFSKPRLLWHPKEPIIICTDMKCVSVLALSEKVCVQKLTGHNDIIRGIAFGDEKLFSCGFDKQIRCWDEIRILSKLKLDE
jgi:WD40 repeat protein